MTYEYEIIIKNNNKVVTPESEKIKKNLLTDIHSCIKKYNPRYTVRVGDSILIQVNNGNLEGNT
jgi:hypothetical protein